ncbi:MAG: very short patch repair endonuclease [Bacteroidota bacterium]|nr:very short patch repair endonuclease [Bacteroidota bacterium]
MDNLTRSQRSKNMRNIRSKDTLMETKIRSCIHGLGFRFRKNVLELPGKPDIVFPSYKVVVFLDSCFWHMCPYHHNIPKTRRSYWFPKLIRNKERAKEVNKKLKNEGWKIIRLWEHQVKNNFDKCIMEIISTLRL